MLEKMPEVVGEALKGVRPGLEKTVYAEIDAPETLTVESSAFADGGAIPARFTEDGEKRSFPLRWTGVPEHAGAVVVVVEDADSPTPWPIVHVLAYDEPGRDGDWPEGALRSPGHEGDGHALGHNSFLRDDYLPPDPPPGHGPHRYVAQVYACKHACGFDKTPGKRDVVEALKRGVLAKGRLIGVYERT
jgi:Raf kinase inhibitor-like YbhB/YbcL family protein